MAMEIEGTIILDIPKVTGVSKAGNNWQKKEWVLETQGQYPRKVKFHVFGDKADSMKFELNKSYAVSFDLESREFNGRWYTDVSAYAMRPLDGAQADSGIPAGGFGNTFQGTQPAPNTDPFGGTAADSTDDLPF